MSKLLTKRLGDVCQVINGRAYKQSELFDNGKYKVLRVGNFFTNNSWYYSDLELDEDKYCDSGDLLFAWSASFGPRIWEGDKTIYHYHIWKMITDSNSIDKMYLYYYLLNKTKSFMSSTHGSIMLHLTKSFMEDLAVVYPESIQTQKSIAKVLSDLDAKIELNNKINQELEAMAKTLYDYWFVQFDFPYEFHKAGTLSEVEVKPYKSSGGKMVYNEELKREIPESWEVKKLKHYLKHNYSSISKSSNYTQIEYLDTSSLTENRISSTQNLNCLSDKIPSRAQRIVLKNDILYSTVRPNQLHFGIIKVPVENMVASTGFAQLSTKVEGVSNDLLYTFITSKWVTNRLQQIAELSVSAYPSISPTDIIELRIALPKDKSCNTLVNANSQLNNSYTLISNNHKQNQQLTALRDWLLPMLMNGQVTVGEAEEKLNSSAELSRSMAAEPQAEYKKG